MSATSTTESKFGLRSADGHFVAVDAASWFGRATDADEQILDRAHAPVLDVGCGPARHVVALAERGVPCLGIDVARPALAVARSRGASVLERCVFDRVPGNGRWGTALLLDGNIGIGGDPAALLSRVASLLRPRGTVLVELSPPGASTAARTVCLEVGGVRGPWFVWAEVAIDHIDRLGAHAGLAVCDRWCVDERWFAELERRVVR